VDSIFKGPPKQLARLAQANRVTITNTVINSPDGSVGSGLTDPRKTQDAWLERAQMTLHYTKEAGIPNTIFLTGNRVPDLTDQQMLESVIEWTKPVVDMAEKAGVTLVVRQNSISWKGIDYSTGSLHTPTHDRDSAMAGNSDSGSP
jgi:sugar phosphate isomerase/epimerase